MKIKNCKIKKYLSLGVFFIASFLFFAGAPSVFAAIGLESSVEQITGGVDPSTQSFTVTSANLLLVGVTTDVQAGKTSSGVTYNGVAMTLEKTVTNAGIVEAKIYSLKAPSVGTFNIVADYNQASGRSFMFAMSFTGVDQTTPIEATGGTAGCCQTISDAVTTITANAWLFDVFHNLGESSTLTAGGSQANVLTNAASNASDDVAAASTRGPVATPASTTMSWTNAGQYSYAHAVVAIRPASISVSGTCKAYDQITNCTDLGTVRVAVNGALQSQTDTGGGTGGTFSISGVTPPASGDVITVFIDGALDADEAVAITKYDGSGAITGMLLYKEHLTIGSADNQTLSNTNLSQYDNSVSVDEDIFVEVNTVAFTCDGIASTTGLCVDGTGQSTQEEVYVVTGNTFTPGGNVNSTNIEIVGTLEAGSNTITIRGSGSPFVVSGGLNLTSATVNYTGSSATTIGGATYSNLGVGTTSDAGAAVTYTLGGDTTVSGTLTIGNASSTNSDVLDASSRTVTLSSTGTPLTITSKGTFTASTSTVNYTGNGATTTVATYNNLGLKPGGATAQTLPAGTTTVSGTLTVGNGTNAGATGATNNPTVTTANLTVAAGATYTTGTGTLTLTGTGTPLTIAGTLTVTANNTVNYTGNGATITCTGASYSNLGLKPSSSSVQVLCTAISQTFTVNKTLTIGDGTNTGATAATNNPTINLLGDVTIAANATYTKGSGTTTFKAGTTQTWTDSTAGQDLGTVVVAVNGTNTTVTASGTPKATGLTINGSQTLSLGSSTLTLSTINNATSGGLTGSTGTLILSGTGTPFTNSGTFTYNTSTIRYTGNGATITSLSGSGGTDGYYNLELKPSSTSQQVLGTGASQTIQVNNNLTVGDGTNAGATAATNNPTLSVTGTTTIAAGATMTTGTGTWTQTGDMTVTGTLSGTAAGTISAAGSVTGAGTINLTTAGTFEQRVGSSKDFGQTSGSNNWNFVTLTFGRSAGTPTITTQTGGSGTITVSSVLNIGKLADGAATILDAGDVTWILSSTGTPLVFNASSTLTGNTSTFQYTGNGATSTASTGYYNLELKPSSTSVHVLGAGTYTVANNLTIGNGTNAGATGATNNPTVNVTGTLTAAANATFTTGTGTITLSSTGTPLTITGTLTVTANNTINYTGNGATVTCTGAGYSNLGLKPSSSSVQVLCTAATQTLTVNKTLTIGDGTNTGATAATNNPTINLIGDLTIAANATYTKGSGTTTFKAGTTQTWTDSTSGQDLGTVVVAVNGTNTTVTASGTPKATGLTIDASQTLSLGSSTLTLSTLTNSASGALTGSTGTLVLSGTGTPFTNSGTFTYNTSTIRYTGNGATITSLSGSGGTDGYYNLELKPSSSSQQVFSSGTVQVNNNLVIGDGTNAGATGATNNPTLNVVGTLTVAANATFNTGTGTITLSSTGTPLVVSGTFTATSGGKVAYTGNGATATAATYYNLDLKPSSTSVQVFGAGAFTVNNNLAIGDGTNAGATGATNNPTVNVTGTLTIAVGATYTTGTGTLTLSSTGTPLVVNGTFTASTSSTVDYTGNGATSTATTYYNLGLKPGSTSVNVLGAGTYTINNNLTIGNGTNAGATGATNNPTVNVTGILTVAANATFTTGTGTITLSNTGTPLVVTGTFTPSTSNTVNYTGNGATSTATTYYNLGLKPGSTSVNVLGAGTYTINNNLTIGDGTNAGATGATNNPTINVTGTLTTAANATFTTGTGTITLSSTGTPLTITGTLTVTANNTINYTGNGATVTCTGASYSNLGLKPSSSSVQVLCTAISQTLTVNKTLTIGDGTNTGATAATNNPTINLIGDLTIAANATYTKGSGTTTFKAGATQTWTDSNATTQDLGAVQVSVNVTNTTLNLASSAKATSLTIDLSQTFSHNGSNTLTLTGTGTPITNNGTLTISTGTIQYSGTTANVLAMTYNNLTLGGTGTYTMPASTTTLRGDLVITSGATVTKGAGTVVFAKGGTQTWTDSNATAQDLGAVQVSVNVTNTTLNLASSAKATSLTIDLSQTFSANGANTLALTGTGTPLTATGTFTASTGTVQYTGTTATVTATTFNNLTLGGAGTYTMPASNTTLRGNLVITSGATVTKGAGTVIFAKGGGGTQTWTDSNGTSQDLGPVQVSANAGNTTLNLASSAKATSLAIDASQTFSHNGANTLTLTGNGASVLANSGTFTASTGIVEFASTATTGTTVPALTFYSLKVNKASNTFTSATGTLTVGGNLDVTAGSLDLTTNDPTTTVTGNITIDGTLLASNSANLTFSGNLTNNGTFTHNIGTVVASPTTTSSITTGGASTLTFQNFTSTAAGKTLQFEASDTTRFDGTLTLTGSNGNPMAIQSGSGGTQWLMNLQGNAAVSFVNVKDGGCAGGTNVISPSGTVLNQGNNGTCWVFISYGGGSNTSATGGSSGGGTPVGGGGQSEGGGGTGGGSGGGIPAGGGGQGGGGASP